MKKQLIIFGLIAGLAPANALAQMVLEFPNGAAQKFEEIKQSSSYKLPLAPLIDGHITTKATEGQMLRQVWRTVDGKSETLTLLAPLRDQLTGAGFEILFECDSGGCGGFDFRFQTDVVDEPDMHVDLGDFRFLSATNTVDGKAEFISLLVSRSADQGYIQVTNVGDFLVAETGAIASTKQTPQPTTTTRDAQSLAELLTLNGAAVLEGLAFANGASGLSGGAADSLLELVQFLGDNPKRSAILVGHTDGSGSLDGNVALSRKRAGAVMQELVEVYGIDPKRLSAEGIGYLSPRASNDTADGRKQNRRVEVVLGPTGQ